MDTRLQPHAPNDLSRRFVDERISPMRRVPESWQCRPDNFYQLDLRMCFITYFRWNFRWGDDSKPTLATLPVLEQPSRLLAIDVSLNDIAALDLDTLQPFKELRSLNASLNRLQHVGGAACLQQLRLLDLSFNQLDDLRDLAHCRQLLELRLQQNHLRSLATLPLLPNLEELLVDGNSLTSLQGLQSAPRLRALSARRNKIADIAALAACKSLQSLDLGHNCIGDLDFFVKILTSLPLLSSLTAKANPVSVNPGYQDALKTVIHHLQHLDGVSLIRRYDRLFEDDPTLVDPNSEIAKFKKLTREAYLDRMRQAKLTMEENVLTLQRRILALMENQREVEKTLTREMENTLRQLDSMDRLSTHNPVSLPPREDLSGQGDSIYRTRGDVKYGDSDLPDDRRDPYDRAWRGSVVKDSDELLRMAALKLGRYQQDGGDG